MSATSSTSHPARWSECVNNEINKRTHGVNSAHHGAAREPPTANTAGVPIWRRARGASGVPAALRRFSARYSVYNVGLHMLVNLRKFSREQGSVSDTCFAENLQHHSLPQDFILFIITKNKEYERQEALRHRPLPCLRR